MPAATKATIKYDRKGLSNDALINLYERILHPRLIEERMLILLRQGRISKWFAGIGQEAISVGATSALLEDELIFTLHRNLGVFTTRDVPMKRLFCQWQGKAAGFTKGRDRSFHFGSLEHGIVGMISHLGPQLSLAAGVGLAHKLKGEGRIALGFTGEGGTSEGEFHEALNTAAVWKLPVIFLIENNGYGLSTPTSEQYACKQLADRGIGYGMEAHTIDGNNILEVYHKIKELGEKMRKNPAPVLLECMTFRRRGHEEASGTKYVPTDLMAYWEERDPVEQFEDWLIREKIISRQNATATKKRIKEEILTALAEAEAEPAVVVNLEQELQDVFAPYQHQIHAPAQESQEMRFVDAISDGLNEAMQRHDNLVLMGQDIGDYGGVFKVTDGFTKTFGAERVRNTTLCESAIVGIGLGLSLKGMKAMVEMQFADFVTCGFNQIVNNLAKLHYRWGENADVVIRMPCGGGVAAGPFHSQTNEAWFFHSPGLKIVYPSSAADAKGLLLAAFADPNPVLFFEHKGLYRQHSSEVSKGYYTTEIGKAAVVREGNDCSIITYGMGVHKALETVENKGIDAEIIDLRSLLPLDWEAIVKTVSKTNRVLVLHEASRTGGIGANIAADIAEKLFEQLDAPVLRLAALDTAVPFDSDLERQYLPWNRLHSELERLITY